MLDDTKISIVGMQNNFKIEGKSVERFISAITPQFVKDAGGILSDTIRFWRFQNQVRILQKTEKRCENNNIPLKEVNLKFLVPLLEHSSLEEDESMQDRWAALLSNVIKLPQNMNQCFIDILRQLTPQEAILLDNLYFVVSNKTRSERKFFQFSKEMVLQIIPLEEDEFDLSLDNLLRLNLCRISDLQNDFSRAGFYSGAGSASGSGSDDGSGYGGGIEMDAKNFFVLTQLGFSFVRSCQIETNNK